jgi:hypothetical protein
MDPNIAFIVLAIGALCAMWADRSEAARGRAQETSR